MTWGDFKSENTIRMKQCNFIRNIPQSSVGIIFSLSAFDNKAVNKRYQHRLARWKESSVIKSTNYFGWFEFQDMVVVPRSQLVTHSSRHNIVSLFNLHLQFSNQQIQSMQLAKESVNDSCSFATNADVRSKR